MNRYIAGIFVVGTIHHYFSLLLFLAAMVIGFVSRYWRLFTQWLSGIRGRDWAAVSAVIEVVSVVVQTENTRSGERVLGYLATLTYFYRNPELQMGEYSRMFGQESEAQAWAVSYKGRNVMVGVDPRDPTRSVLRKEDL